jgi:elongation factor Ts
MLDCRQALEQTDGNIEQAVEHLRRQAAAEAAKRAQRLTGEGQVGSYIHHDAKVGALVEVNCETDFVARTPEFQALVKDVSMHIAATSPLYVTKEEVPLAVLEHEKEIYKAQAAAQGKPPNIAERIAEGKLKDYYSTFVLLEQSFVKDQAKTVGQLVQEKIALIKENIVIRRFARFKVGEEVQAASKGTADEPLVPATR